jgi:hypothetical protein
MEHVEDLTSFSNRLANIAECISEVLQAACVLSNVHVTLDKVYEISFKIHGAVEFIVTELVMDANLDDVRPGPRDTHDGERIPRDGIVKPTQEALTTGAPL